MAQTIRIVSKDLNADRLREELGALATALTSVSWAGFARLPDGRRYTPNAARKLVGYSVSNGQRTEDFADPGELRFATARDLDAAEQSQLDSILAAHNAAQLSAEQLRQDKDAADAAELISTGAATLANDVFALNAAVAAWDVQTTAQKLAATKAALNRIAADLAILGKAMRLVLRSKGADLN